MTKMVSRELKLRTLRVEDEVSFRNAVAAFKNETPPFEFAFDFDESTAFSEYVEKLAGWSKGEGVPETFVPSTFLVGVVDGEIVGRLSLRHRLNEFLKKIGGHIGYGVIPKHRRKGYATAMLKQSFPICASLGLDNVLVTCDVNNIGSIKVIEGCGGVLENITNDPTLEVQKRRYWISTNLKE